MGVNHEHIVLYGYELPYGTFEDKHGWEITDEYDYRDKESGDLALVSDGMSGEYELFGILLYKSGSNRHGEATIPLMEIPRWPEAEKRDLLTRTMRDLNFVGEEKDDASNYVFTHYR